MPNFFNIRLFSTCRTWLCRARYGSCPLSTVVFWFIPNLRKLFSSQLLVNVMNQESFDNQLTFRSRAEKKHKHTSSSGTWIFFFNHQASLYGFQLRMYLTFWTLNRMQLEISLFYVAALVVLYFFIDFLKGIGFVRHNNFRANFWRTGEGNLQSPAYMRPSYNRRQHLYDASARYNVDARIPQNFGQRRYPAFNQERRNQVIEDVVNGRPNGDDNDDPVIDPVIKGRYEKLLMKIPEGLGIIDLDTLRRIQPWRWSNRRHWPVCHEKSFNSWKFLKKCNLI